MSHDRTTHMQNDAYRPKLWSFVYRGILKNVFDSTLALIGLIVLSPLLILIAIRIKQDSSGPILVKQKCEGLRGHPFKMYKFRTHETVTMGPAHTQKQLRRETYIGTVLIDANLENLPQLFNVFIGDMSLVGPRPNPVALTINNVGIDQIVPNYKNRTLVKPGMTGWAQINGLRGPLKNAGDAAQRVRYDLDYSKEASFLVDCAILYRTLPLLKRAPSA